MSIDPFAELLKDATAHRLNTLQGEIERQIAELKRQKDAISRELSSRTQARTAKRTRTKKTTVGKRQQKRRLIKDVVATDPNGQWMPARIAQALTEKGEKTTADSLRPLLRRMAEEGDGIAKHPSGQGYTGARSSNGSDPPDDDEA